MQKLFTENKRLYFQFDGENVDVERLNEKIEDFLGKYERCSDPNEQHTMRMQWAELSSAVEAMSKVRSSYESLDTAVRLRQIKRQQADIEAASQAAETFSQNCLRIASNAYARFSGEPDPGWYSDYTSTWQRKVVAYCRKLQDALSYDVAQKQVDEILDSGGRPGLYGLEHRPAREWREIVPLPKPDKAPPVHAYTSFP